MQRARTIADVVNDKRSDHSMQGGAEASDVGIFNSPTVFLAPNPSPLLYFDYRSSHGPYYSTKCPVVYKRIRNGNSKSGGLGNGLELEAFRACYSVSPSTRFIVLSSPNSKTGSAITLLRTIWPVFVLVSSASQPCVCESESSSLHPPAVVSSSAAVIRSHPWLLGVYF
eukprot:1833111-Rhodomonas_salina.5